MISLCMIVKNEEHNLTRCLKSAQGCVDEIIIVDTGSEDNTIAIAKQFGAKIYRYQWQEDFAAARNFSVNQATGDWILYLDADEELEADCCQRLRSLTTRDDVEAYIFQIINLTDNNDPLKHVNVRMFRNKPEYRFEGSLHEQIISSIKTNQGGHPVINCGINILHYGYLAKEFIKKNKARRNHRINSKLVEQDPNNPFYLYSLGGSCVNLNDLAGAVANYRKALQNVNLRAMYAPSIFVSLISCLLKMDQLEEAVDYIEQCRTNYPDYVDIYFIEGELFNNLGHIKRAVSCFKKCLELGEQCNGRYTSRSGVGSFLANFKLAELYQSEGDYQQALQYQIQGLKLKNNDMRQYFRLAQILKASLDSGAKVYEILKTNVRHQDKETEKLMLGRMLFEIEEFRLACRLFSELNVRKNEVVYFHSLALIKSGRLKEAALLLNEIVDQQVYQRVLLELVTALWCSAPPVDALSYLDRHPLVDQEFINYLKGVNELVIRKHSDFIIKPQNQYFNQIINLLLSQKQFEIAYHILSCCGLDSPFAIISYLTETPYKQDRFELAARLALQELKRGDKEEVYYHALCRYFYDNGEYESALGMLQQAVSLAPQSTLYESLQKEIYLKQTLMMIKEALKYQPGNPQFNRWLINIGKQLKKDTSLKGVH